MCIRCILRYVVIVASLGAVYDMAIALAEPTAIRYSEPQEKTIITQRVVTLSVQNYNPPYELQILTSGAKTSYQSPETALSVYFSALAREDWDGSRKVVDEQVKGRLRAEQAADPAAYEREKQQGIALGKAALTKGQAVLRERVQVPGVVVIITELVSKDTGKVVLRLPFSLRKENGDWKLTEARHLDELTRRALYSEYPFEGNTLRVEVGYVLRTHRPVDKSFRLDNPLLSRRQ